MARTRATAYVGPARGRPPLSPIVPKRGRVGTPPGARGRGRIPIADPPVVGAPVVEVPVADVAESIVPEARDRTVLRSEAQGSPPVRTGEASIEATVFKDYVRQEQWR